MVIYSLPNCIQCKFTKEKSEEYGVAFEEVDLSTDMAAAEKVRALGYQSAPVVITESGEHWSGFRIDLIKKQAALVAA